VFSFRGFLAGCSRSHPSSRAPSPPFDSDRICPQTRRRLVSLEDLTAAVSVPMISAPPVAERTARAASCLPSCGSREACALDFPPQARRVLSSFGLAKSASAPTGCTCVCTQSSRPVSISCPPACLWMAVSDLWRREPMRGLFSVFSPSTGIRSPGSCCF
jgi:hypothetical protein